jgi:hypothetical protein
MISLTFFSLLSGMGPLTNRLRFETREQPFGVLAFPHFQDILCHSELRDLEPIHLLNRELRRPLTPAASTA